MAKKKKEIDNFVTVNDKTYAIISADTSDGRVNRKSMPISVYYNKFINKEIVNDKFVQRTDNQWTRKRQSELISSIYYNRPIGAIVTTCDRFASAKKMAKSLLDGLQRTTAICGYINNDYALSKNTKPLTCVCKSEDGETIKQDIEVAGKKFSQLPPVVQQIILDYDLTVYEYVGFTDDELDDIIYNINNGVSFKPNQKLRLAFGTNVMKHIQPICENAIWDNVDGCNAKNDSILGCITRTLMIMLDCGCDLSATEMINFAEDFDIGTNLYVVQVIGKLLDRLNDIVCSSKFSDEDIAFFNACNIPHIIDAFEQWKGTDEQFADFLVSFLHSSARIEYNEYAAMKSGSGAKQYSYESVSSRRSVILNTMTDYIADNDIKEIEVETDEEAEPVDCADNTRVGTESDRPNSEGESAECERLLLEAFEDNECGKDSWSSGCSGGSDSIELSEQYSGEWQE